MICWSLSPWLFVCRAGGWAECDAAWSQGDRARLLSAETDPGLRAAGHDDGAAARGLQRRAEAAAAAVSAGSWRELASEAKEERGLLPGLPWRQGGREKVGCVLIRRAAASGGTHARTHARTHALPPPPPKPLPLQGGCWCCLSAYKIIHLLSRVDLLLSIWYLCASSRRA